MAVLPACLAARGRVLALATQKRTVHPIIAENRSYRTGLAKLLSCLTAAWQSLDQGRPPLALTDVFALY